jgi:type IV secretory pathway VirJ component
MRSSLKLLGGCLLILCVAAGARAKDGAETRLAPAPHPPFALSAGRFGEVTVYQPAAAPRSVALFISGDGGWNRGVIDMAERLRADGALVAGVDITHYFRELEQSSASCEYLGAEFERLSKLVQQRAGVVEYQTPVLVGYSSGATLVYALLNQTPKGVFAGGLSLGFCPDLELAKPLCRGEGLAATRSAKHKGVELLRVASLPAPWVALHGDRDQVCSASATARFVSGMSRAQLVSLPRVGHGYSVPANWLPQFRDAYSRVAAAAGPKAPVARTRSALADLPIVEVPASAGQSDELVVLVTGDGGYAGMDQDLAAGFAARGRPTAVLNSLKYFWVERKPEQVATDLERIIRHYAATWHKSHVLLVGYSMGADVLPFAVNRLPPEQRAAVRAAALIGISESAVFEFTLANWLSSPEGIPTRPELDRLTGVRVVCVYGSEESGSVCPRLPPDRFRLVELPGGHHFNGDYQAVVAAVLRELAS